MNSSRSVVESIPFSTAISSAALTLALALSALNVADREPRAPQMQTLIKLSYSVIY